MRIEVQPDIIIPWFVYILLCDNGQYYVGISPNPQRRLLLHKSGTGSQFTKDHKPINIVYTKQYTSKSEARKREMQLKGWSHKKKQMLISGILD